MSTTAAVSSVYVAVKRLAREKPDWLPIVAACRRLALTTDTFAGRWVHNDLEKHGWSGLFTGLKMLESYGIVEHVKTTRAEQRAYWKMPDIAAVTVALFELGVAP